MSAGRIVGVLVLAVAIAAAAFAAGRATRPQASGEASPAATVRSAPVDVSIPRLAVARTIPGLRSAPAEKVSTPQAVPPASGSAPSASAPSGGGTTSGGGGGSSTPTIVGGGTD